MSRPEGMVHFIPPGQEDIQNFISSAANRSVRPYSTNEEYLYAMKEDLAEWFKELYGVNIHVDNFIEFLQDGILLCEHANRVNDQANEFRKMHRGDPMLRRIILPSKAVQYTPGRHASTFFARDNVANFINWCRKELLIAEAVMFESNDLILRKNEKNFILCLLEVARRGSKFGVPAPVLIQMEEEIDEEIQQDLREEQQSEEDQEEEEVRVQVREPPKQKIACDFKSLDEMVQYILGMCTCPTQFPMVKVSEGKYKVGDSRTLIFMRILRNHVMVRVGGGWDTLEHYLDKHDPCRCNRHRVEQKITARIRDLGLVLTPDEEQQLINRAKRDTRDFKARNRTLSSRSSQGISVKQAAEVMNKAGPARNSETSRSKEDWSNMKSQSLPGFTKELSTPSSSGRASRVMTPSSEPSRSSKSSGRRSESVNQNRLVHSLEVDGRRHTETRPAPDNTDRQRSHSPAPNKRSKALSRYSTTTKAPEIRVSKSGPNDPLNQTHTVGSRTSTGNPLSSKTLSLPSENRTSPRSPLGRSKTPTPGSLRSSSTGSLSHCLEPRRSVTPTPTVTSQRRAELSLRAKSPNPDKMLAASTENKRPTRSKAPPSSYKVSETSPRNHHSMERSPRRETTTSVPSWNSSNGDKKYNSLPRPSSAMSYKGMTETDSGRKSTLSVSSGKSHHRSLQDIRQPPRPKSALGTNSTTSNLSTVPKTPGRKTIATTTAGNDSMQRLTAKSRSRSVDNLSIQKQLGSSTMSTMNQRNQLFARLSQPKSTPKNRAHSNLLDEDVLFVERRGEGRHSVQRDSVQRPTSLDANSRSREERNGFAREGSTSSEASSHNAQSSITPSDLRLRIKPFRGQGSVGSLTPSPSRDSALASSLRLSVSMSGSPESPTSRVSCSWTPDSGGDELDSPSSGQPIHTPKIINRHNKESHLKAPPMRKVSKEEVLHVVRNPEGHHQWEHTDKSLEQSQEYFESSPYKEQLSPRSSQGERQLKSSFRKASSSSDSSVISPGGPNAVNMRVSKAQIILGKPVRSSTPNRLTVATELQASNIRRKNDIASTSSSSIASSRSSLDGSRRKPNITDQVRSMLFTEDGKPKPPNNKCAIHGNSSVRSPRISSTPRLTTNQRPTTPKNEVQLRITTQSRPLTPKNPTRSTTPRPKTPDSRRGTLTRHEKLKSFDGPSPKKQADPLPPPETQDKETRMLREFEREFSENQKILAASAASGDSEDTKSGNESADHKMQYDYNGRRISKKPLRSKSPSNLRSKSAPRMQRMSSCDSEFTNRSYERADSMADSEDFEVAMAMSGGAKRSSPSTGRSRSVNDFLDERGPKPRKDKHDSRKSRIPTPTNFNSGRKSATGVPYHDSNMSKSALRSNVEGVGTYELDATSHRKGQGSFDDTRDAREQVERGREKMKFDDDRRHRPQKENIQPPRVDAWIPDAEEYDLNNQECFKFGRYRNTKSKSPRKNPEIADDFVDGRQQFYHREEITASYVENQYVQLGKMQHFNTNNNNNDSLPIGQPTNQSEEPIPPPRKTGGYHRSNLHTSPADMLKANRPTNQIHSRQNEPSNQRQVQNERIQFARDFQSTTREQQQGFLGHLPQDRSDSGIEVGTDPDSPGSNSAISLRARSGASGGSVFSPNSSQSWENHQPTPKQSAHEVNRSHVTGPQHGVLETPKGKYFFVAQGHQNSRLHTGYDAPRQNQPQGYQSDQVATGYQNQSRKDQAPRQHMVGISQPQQSPKPACYQQENQGSHSKNQSHGYQSSQQNDPNSNAPKYQYATQNAHSASYNQAPGSYQGYGSNQLRLDSSRYPPASPSVTSPSVYSRASDSRNASASTIEGSRTRHQAQHSPNYEQDRPEDAENHQKPSAGSPSSRISKRPNFNDFFTDNRKLKDSLNNLNSLYNEDSPGNAFQLEDVPLADNGTPRSQADISRSSDLYGNAFALSYGDKTPTSSPNQNIFPLASGGAPPQYATPPGYNTPKGGSNQGNPPVHYSSSTFPRSVRKDSNNNAPSYPNMGMGQYPQDDTAPAPPPRHKIQHKAFERQKLPTNAPRYYTNLNNDPESNQPDSDASFQFANGLDLRQASEKRAEEYV